MRKNILFTLPFFFYSFSYYQAQTKEEKIHISSFSNKTSNSILDASLRNNEKLRKDRLNKFILENPNFEIRSYLKNDGIQELMDVLPNGEFIYSKTFNEGAGITARANKLYSGGSLGINIQGQNMTAGVWDGGSVRETHQEFVTNSISKITNMNSGTAYANHATHVMGTICAKGQLSTVKGIAFNASGISYDWTNDLQEMLDEASNGMLVSNHSYGIGALNSLWFFGAYDSRAKDIDNICYNNPFYLPVFSAGNSRNDTTTPPASTQIANKSGYDLIFGHGNAKNVITVAAVNEVLNYTDPSVVTMSSFSSWGPSDDGRIKPDISMKGVNVRSTLSTGDSSTGFMSGTSMASPGVTGVALLLQQYYNQLYSSYMKAATLKGLILHNADEAGFSDGPDYEFGWGLINAEKAAMTIRNKSSITTSKSIIEELSLANGSTYTKTITANGTNPLKVSISWTDPQAPTANTGTTDPTVKYLVNDLDVKLTKNDTTYYPWKMQGMSSPWTAATNTGTNDVDNFERVDINNPSGTYTITVTHKGTLSGGNQNFSLIVTSDNLSTLGVQDISKDEQKVDFYPNPAKDFIYINEKESDLNISVYDVSGKLVINSKLVNNKLNINHLAKGNYIGSYITKNGAKKNFKFVKE